MKQQYHCSACDLDLEEDDLIKTDSQIGNDHDFEDTCPACRGQVWEKEEKKG